MKCNDPRCPWCYPNGEPEEERFYYPNSNMDFRDEEDDKRFSNRRRKMRDDNDRIEDRFNDRRDDWRDDWKDDRKDDRRKPNTQTHVHEYAGSTMLAGSIIHNHRVAGVTSEAIPYGKSHIHAILDNTDFFFNHYHEVGIRTGPAIPVGEGRHIHFVKGETTTNFGHDHDFIFTTFIENPIEEDQEHFK